MHLTLKQGLVQAAIVLASTVSSVLNLMWEDYPSDIILMCISWASVGILIISVVILVGGIIDWDNCLVIFVVPMCIIHSFLYFFICLIVLATFSKEIIFGFSVELWHSAYRVSFLASSTIGMLTCFLMVFNIVFLYHVRDSEGDCIDV